MFIKDIYLSIFTTIIPNIIAPIILPISIPEYTLFLLLSLILLTFAPVPKILLIVHIINCIGYIRENILIKFLSTNIPSKNHPKIGVNDVSKSIHFLFHFFFYLFHDFI